MSLTSDVKAFWTLADPGDRKDSENSHTLTETSGTVVATYPTMPQGHEWAPASGYSALLNRGSDGLITVGSDTTIDEIWDGGGSISFWAKINTITGSATHSIIHNAAWEISHMADYTNVNCWRLFYDWDGATNGDWITSANTADAGHWIHVVVTYNADATTNDPNFYINGVLESESEIATPDGTRVADAANNKTIGRATHGPDANITAFFMTTDIITAGEAKTLFNGGRGYNYADTIDADKGNIDNIAAYWELDEAASEFFDSTANNNDGTQTGGVLATRHPGTGYYRGVMDGTSDYFICGSDTTCNSSS